MNFYFFLFIVPLFIFPSCGKRYTKLDALVVYNIPLYLCMPQNKHVLFNLSPLLYTAFWEHFDRVGYAMKDAAGIGYTLKVEVCEFEGAEKFISPDFLTYGSRLRLCIRVQLLDEQGACIVEKDFTQTTTFFRPQHPVLNSAYLEFVTTKMLKMLSLRVDHYFRNYMVPTKQ